MRKPSRPAASTFLSAIAHPPVLERFPPAVAQKFGESRFSVSHRVNTPDMVRPIGAPRAWAASESEQAA